MAEEKKGISGAQWAALATVTAALLGLCGTLAGFALNCVDKTGNIYCYRQAPTPPPPASDTPAFPQSTAVPTQTASQPFIPTGTLPPDIPTSTPTWTPSLIASWTPSLTSTATSTKPSIVITFDLYALAPSAYWSSGAGPLTFGGPANASGYVQYENGIRLEDGTTSNKTLTTHPQWVDDGVIKGLYPPYTIAAGDHFRAQVGYIALFDGSCGLRSVKFQLHYTADGEGWTTLGEWTKHCDYTLTSIDIDLNPIAGKTVKFNPVVLANGSASQDWAVWVNPRIEH
jgi:hypothetical protein